MMYRFFIILFGLVLSFTAMGQDLKVVSVNENKTQLKDAVFINDMNGHAAAIVLLEFRQPISGIVLKGNILNYNSVNDSTYLVYVPEGTKRITLQHSDYYPLVISFSDFGVKIFGEQLYKVIIDNEKPKSSEPVISQYLVFHSNENCRLYVNGIEWTSGDVNSYYDGDSFLISKYVPLGDYEYKAISSSGITITGTAKVKTRLARKVVYLDFENAK